MANANRNGDAMKRGTVGHQHVAPADADLPDEHDLANRMHGSNQLQGNDQSSVQNQRLTQPGSLDERNQPSDSPVEEARRQDGSHA